MTTLAGLSEPTLPSYESLAALMKAGEVAALFLDSDPVFPVGWRIVENVPLLQMVHDGSTPTPAIEAVELSGADAPQMLALAELANPGPFGARTHELGTYLGIRHGDKLVAMVGERLRVPGYGEISAVCTHPQHAGQGYANALVAALVCRIRARNEVPFLHVRPENDRAVALYERLGFQARMTFQLVVQSRDGE